MSRMMVVALLASLPSAALAQRGAPQERETRYVTEPTVMRVAPRADADSAGTLTSLRRGNLVGVHGCARGWCEVTYYPRRGYVEESRLSRTYVPYDEVQTAASRPAAQAAGADTAADIVEGIRRRCGSEWPDDYRMQEYCIGQQRGAAVRLASLLQTHGGITESVFRGIARKCSAEWGDDYRMVVHCIEQQVEAYRRIRR